MKIPAKKSNKKTRKSRLKRKALKQAMLKGHDKSGTRHRKRLLWYTRVDVPGGATPEASSGIRGRLKAFGSPKQARQAMIAYYRSQGYVLKENNIMYHPDRPAIMLGKLSSIPSAKIGKAGRIMMQSNGSGGVI